MKKIVFFLSFCLFFGTYQNVFSTVTQIKNLEFEEVNKELKVKIFYNGISPNPILEKKQNILQLSFENAKVWPKIEKVFWPSQKELGPISYMAYQFDSKTVRVRMIFPKSIPDQWPFSVEKYGQEEISLLVSIGPKEKIAEAEAKAEVENVPSLEKFLEEKVSDVKVQRQENQENQEVNKKSFLTDSVTLEQSSPVKTVKKEETISATPIFSLTKFFVVFSLMIAGVIGLGFLSKKIVLGKKNLSLLKSNVLVKVISTTYLGPKSKLVLVSVQDEILLLAETANQITYIKQISAPGETYREVERELTGSNFEKIYLRPEVQNSSKEQKIKQNIYLSEEEGEVQEFIPQGLSQTLKQKIKTLRPLG